jgi:hypothetical protein
MNQQHVEIKDLKVGDAFIADWRPEGKQIGILVDKSESSVAVKIPDLYDDGKFEGSEGSCRWSTATLVIPTTREEFNLSRSGGNRERSATTSPVEKVHAICDSMPNADRKDIIAKCVADGINANTAKTQYYAWRKKRGQ